MLQRHSQHSQTPPDAAALHWKFRPIQAKFLLMPLCLCDPVPTEAFWWLMWPILAFSSSPLAVTFWHPSILLVMLKARRHYCRTNVRQLTQWWPWLSTVLPGMVFWSAECGGLSSKWHHNLLTIPSNYINASCPCYEDPFSCPWTTIPSSHKRLQLPGAWINVINAGCTWSWAQLRAVTDLRLIWFLKCHCCRCHNSVEKLTSSAFRRKLIMICFLIFQSFSYCSE